MGFRVSCRSRLTVFDGKELKVLPLLMGRNLKSCPFDEKEFEVLPSLMGRNLKSCPF